MKPYIVDRTKLKALIQNGTLDKSTAVSDDSNDHYLISTDLTGRIALVGIGAKHHLKVKL